MHFAVAMLVDTSVAEATFVEHQRLDCPFKQLRLQSMADQQVGIDNGFVGGADALLLAQM